MTGSEVGRLLACPTSAVLPRSDSPSKWSDQGAEMHLRAEVAAELGDLDGLPVRVAEMIRGATSVLTEIVIIYDAATDTAIPLPGVRDREYPADLRPFEIPMTVDLVAFFDDDRGRRAVVIDHKLFAAQGPPRAHGQLMTEALAVARAYGVDDIEIAISYLGTGFVDRDRIDTLDLALHADRLSDLHLRVAEARRAPAPAPGEHCRHCPAWFACPAWSSRLELVRTGAAAAQVERSIPFEIDEDASAGMALLRQINAMSARLTAALHARAKQRPIPVGDGLVWGPVEAPGNERLDGATVYAVAADTFGRAHAVGFVEMRATKRRIGEQIATLILGRKEALGAEREMLAEIRRRGGSERAPSIKYVEHEPRAVTVTDDHMIGGES